MSIGTVARAYQLADSGLCRTVSEIGQHLRRERYESVDEHLRAPTLNRELRERCKATPAAAISEPVIA